MVLLPILTRVPVRTSLQDEANFPLSDLLCQGFWLTFVSFLLLCLAGCTVCFGRRRDRMSGATTYPVASKLSLKDRLRMRFRR